MHDFYGIHEIKRKWNSHSKFIPMPLPIIREFFKEGINILFGDLSAIKNYYGEKFAFL
jgi:hypothetical protein